MPQFAYFGRDVKLQPMRGVLESSSPAQVAEILISMGITPVKIEPHVLPVEASETLARMLGRHRVREPDLLMFARQMYSLLKAGVPILRALQGLQESSRHIGMKAVLKDLRQSLDAGLDLSQAMGRRSDVFSLFFVSMVRVGEATGQLAHIFLTMHDHLDFQRTIREQIKAALRYPKFVMFAMAAAMVVINLFVIPSFAKVFASFNTELPLMTRILLGTSKAMMVGWPYMLVGLIAVVLGVRSFLATPNGRLLWDRYKLNLPVVGKLILKGSLARSCRSLALVLKSGVSVLEGLGLAADVAENAYIEQAIHGMSTSIERGESVLAAAQKAGIFTPIVLQMIMVGEESGTLDEMLEEVGQIYQREMEYELKNMSQQIEPILIFVLGMMVLVLALGVFMPMWDLGKAALK